MQSLKDFREYFNPIFKKHLIERVNEMISYQKSFKPMGEQLIKIAEGGKRLRPFIALTAYKGNGGKDVEKILPVLIGLELYHLFALIHDDIIDQSSARHGVPCLHTTFGIEQAILIGDLCVSWALECAAVLPPLMRTRFFMLSKETIVGQMVDVSLIQVPEVQEKMITQSIELKTARYSFIGPMMLGVLATSRRSNDEIYENLGRLLGKAFQRIDDLSDIFASAEELGKQPCGDIAQGTPTHISFYLQQHGTAAQKKQLKQHWGDQSKKRAIKEIRQLFIESGAYDYESAILKKELSKARSLVEQLTTTGAIKLQWLELIDYLEHKFTKLVLEN